MFDLVSDFWNFLTQWDFSHWNPSNWDFSRWTFYYWVPTLLFLTLGILGAFLPIIPSHLFIVFAAASHWYFGGDQSGITLYTVFILLALWLLATFLEFLSGALGSRWFGGSRWGSFGAITGGIIGLFFLPIGLLLGPLIGASLAEWVIQKKPLPRSIQSGLGSVFGILTGLATNIFLLLLMIGYFLADIFWIS